MIIGFCQEFHATGICKVAKRLQYIRPVHFKLFNNGTAEGITDPEFSFMLFDQLQHGLVGFQVAFFRDLMEDADILFIILVKMILPYIKK